MHNALAVVALVFTLLPTPSLACTCQYIDAIDARTDADVVFAGVVERVTMIDSDRDFEPRVIVTFHVGRVWKGDVSARFSMHTNLELSSCAGFFRELAQPRQELLVYGIAQKGVNWKRRDYGMPHNARSATFGRSAESGRPRLDAIGDDEVVYTTNICAGSKMWEHADIDLRDLGPFAVPKGGIEMKNPPSYEASLPPELEDVPRHCWGLRMAREWKVVPEPPEAAQLLKLLRDFADYNDTNGSASAWVDVWYRDPEGFVAICRSPKEGRCGRMTAMFRTTTTGDAQSEITHYDAPTCRAPE